MKAALIKTHQISFREKTSQGYVQKSFETPKEHLDWHMTQMKKSPSLDNIKVDIKKG